MTCASETGWLTAERGHRSNMLSYRGAVMLCYAGRQEPSHWRVTFCAAGRCATNEQTTGTSDKRKSILTSSSSFKNGGMENLTLEACELGGHEIKFCNRPYAPCRAIFSGHCSYVWEKVNFIKFQLYDSLKKRLFELTQKKRFFDLTQKKKIIRK